MIIDDFFLLRFLLGILTIQLLALMRLQPYVLFREQVNLLQKGFHATLLASALNASEHPYAKYHGQQHQNSNQDVACVGIMFFFLLLQQFCIAIFSSIFREQFTSIMIVERVAQLIKTVYVLHGQLRIAQSQHIVERLVALAFVEQVFLFLEDGQCLVKILHGCRVILLPVQQESHLVAGNAQ